MESAWGRSDKYKSENLRVTDTEGPPIASADEMNERKTNSQGASVQNNTFNVTVIQEYRENTDKSSTIITRKSTAAQNLVKKGGKIKCVNERSVAEIVSSANSCPSQPDKGEQANTIPTDNSPGTSKKTATDPSAENLKKANKRKNENQEAKTEKRIKKGDSEEKEEGGTSSGSETREYRKFHAYAKQGKPLIAYRKSENPCVLLKSVELYAYRGNWEEAEKDLKTAEKNSLNCTHPSSNDLVNFAKLASEQSPLRAALFRALSAMKKKAVEKSDDAMFFCSTAIFEIEELVKDMARDMPPRKEMTNGVQYRDIAERFVIPTMIRVFEERCSLEGVSNSAKAHGSRAYALSWIAVACLRVNDNQKAIDHGKQGIEEIKKCKDRKCETYGRLLHNIGEAEKNMGHGREAKSWLKEAIEAYKEARDFKTEEERKKCIRFPEKLLDEI